MKSPLIHLIGALVLCAVSFIGYGIWYAAIAEKSAAVADLENQINIKTDTASRIASARTALAEISGDEAAVRSYFIPETGIVAFIDSLQSQGRAHGAAVSVLSVSSGGTSAHPTFIFAITVKGSFNSVMNTVGAIEYLPYALSISSLSLGQDGKNSWHAAINLLVSSVPLSTSANTPYAAPSVSVPVTTPSSAASSAGSIRPRAL